MSWRTLRPFVAGASIVLVLVIAVVAFATSRNREQSDRAAPPVASQPTARPTDPSSSEGAPAPAADPVSADLDRLRAAAQVEPGPAAKRIVGDLASQPDLYAAEFVRRLLTQDYRTSRADHLAWVQSESAETSEPLVVGLVPKELRTHLAVYSVTETSGATPAVPTPREWLALSVLDGFTTVRIERVEEPMAWSTAVSNGRVTDPGVTGREVSATVTLHYRKQGRPVTSTSSVAMAINLQGPPTRGTWGFVTAVTYSSLAVNAS